VFRWIIYAPVRSIVSSLKEARLTREDPHLPRSSSLFAPLLSEVSTMQKSLREARMSAQEEARLGLEKAESPWTAQRLQEFIKDSLKGRPVVVVSNREPYIHTKTGKTIAVHVPASGMVTALEPVMTAVEGTWIAWGSGDADREVVDERDAVRVPPDEPKYTLRRVWLTKEEEKKYYDGFCNEGLWPLCHISHTRPTFRKEDWEVYKKVNGLFAQTVLDEIKDTHRPIVLIQDFHLALLPRIIKNARPDATIGLFWHIPWPNPESFSICPWKKELVDGMLGADMIGFHTQLHCNNFVETISRELESLIDYEQFAVARGGHTSHVRSFPISIAFNNGNTGKSDASEEKDDAEFLKSLGVVTPLLGFGVDRLDYTKGILERLKAIEIFFEANPSYVGKFTFVQIAAPSRTKVARYREYGQAVRDEVKRINDAYGKKGWQPIVLIVEHHSHQDLARLYRKTNVCVVTSLHDGMNLVAKEFVAARNDEKGVLVLSQFAGASKELRDALIVNPYNAEQTAEAIKTALTMMESEQKRRMRRMRATVKSHNVYQWSAGLLRKLLDV
jgi:trehalose 6-phosphate synthase